MFGLTKREQRWKAEQKALETFAPILVALASSTAAKHTEEVERLRRENTELRAKQLVANA